jgi:dihydroorotase
MTVDLDLSRVWLVDPVRGREGPAEVVVRRGVIRSMRWLRGAEAEGVTDRGVVVAPAFTDLHAHFREPGNDAAETVASGMRAAAHGGFGTVYVMPNTDPPIDGAGAVARLRDAALSDDGLAEDEWHPEVRAWGAVTAGRHGEQLSPMAELAASGAVFGFSDDGAPVRSAAILRNALAYAGALGLPIVDHPEDPSLTDGAEANDGLVATVLGLKGWPASAEVSAVARDIAILEDVLPDVPGARLHLTHLSVAGSFDLVRAAKARGLPVTCDVTPHHLALSDEWVAGARRWAWQALDGEGRRRDPWVDGALEAEPYDTATKVNPPLRSPEDAAACRRALRDGTADAIATDHAPHGQVDKAVEFGLAPNGISGIETALGVVLAAVDAGELSLLRAIELLTTGPSGVVADARAVAGRAPSGGVDFRVGSQAAILVFDRGATWDVTAAALSSKGKNSPLIGRPLAGRVLLATSLGFVTYRDDALTA